MKRYSCQFSTGEVFYFPFYYTEDSCREWMQGWLGKHPEHEYLKLTVEHLQVVDTTPYLIYNTKETE